MQVTLSNLTIDERLRNLDLSIQTDGIAILYDETETAAECILRCLIGLDEWQEGQLLLDGEDWADYISRHALVKTFAYVFEDGTMMSNLSLRENLYLPYQLRWESDGLERFDSELSTLLDRFGLNIDMHIRPASIKPAERKLLCFVQALLLRPTVLLINNPLYLLNHRQRSLLISILTEYAKAQAMIIATSDCELIGKFADQVVKFEPHEQGFSIKFQQILDTECHL